MPLASALPFGLTDEPDDAPALHSEEDADAVSTGAPKRPIFGARSPVAMDLLDAAALLWRLHLRGEPVAERHPASRRAAVEQSD